MNVLEGLLKGLLDLTKRVNRLEAMTHYRPRWNLGTPVELTIAAGVVTITQSNHTIDTQGNAPADDLDTINGGVTGDVIFLHAANSARTVVIKNATGNILMPADMTLDNTVDIEMLYYDGTNWNEVTGSSNGA